MPAADDACAGGPADQQLTVWSASPSCRVEPRVSLDAPRPGGIAAADAYRHHAPDRAVAADPWRRVGRRVRCTDTRSRCRRAPAGARARSPRSAAARTMAPRVACHGRNSSLKDELSRAGARWRLRRRWRWRAGGVGRWSPRPRVALAVPVACGVADSGPNSRAAAARWRRRRSWRCSRAGALAASVSRSAVRGRRRRRGRAAATVVVVAGRRGRGCADAARRCVARRVRGDDVAVGFGANSCASGPAHTAAMATPAQLDGDLGAEADGECRARADGGAARRAPRPARRVRRAPPPRPTTAPTRAASRSHAPMIGTPITSSSPRARSAKARQCRQSSRWTSMRAASWRVKRVPVRSSCRTGPHAGPDSALVNASSPRSLARVSRRSYCERLRPELGGDLVGRALLEVLQPQDLGVVGPQPGQRSLDGGAPLGARLRRLELAARAPAPASVSSPASAIGTNSRAPSRRLRP